MGHSVATFRKKHRPLPIAGNHLCQTLFPVKPLSPFSYSSIYQSLHNKHNKILATMGPFKKNYIIEPINYGQLALPNQPQQNPLSIVSFFIGFGLGVFMGRVFRYK
jgi:hypothetical protein